MTASFILVVLPILVACILSVANTPWTTTTTNKKNDQDATDNRAKIEHLFDLLWEDYTTLNPSMETISQYFVESSENNKNNKNHHPKVINDHIALRTFRIAGWSKEYLVQDFVALGYQLKGHYTFPSKHLVASHYEGPYPDAPRIFVSELIVEELPSHVQDIIHEATRPPPPPFDSSSSKKDDHDFVCTSGRHYLFHPHSLPNYATYQLLLNHSEYAAWVYAFGLRANHFTVSVNALIASSLPKHSDGDRTLPIQSLQDVNTLLRAKGVVLHTQADGTAISGSPHVYLEQSSTIAERVSVQFDKGERHDIPACFYEFALRYPVPPQGD